MPRLHPDEQDVVDSRSRPVSEIVGLVCEHYDITAKSLRSNRRYPRLVSARIAVCHLMRTAGYGYADMQVAVNRHFDTVRALLQKPAPSLPIMDGRLSKLDVVLLNQIDIMAALLTENRAKGADGLLGHAIRRTREVLS